LYRHLSTAEQRINRKERKLKAYILLNPDYIEDIRLAASKMHGYERRSYMAEMTIKYCDGKSRRAETVFGWNRNAVETGLGEKRTGIVCIGAQSVASGRIPWEKKEQEAAEMLRMLADEHSQQDPSFRSAIAYTRLTAMAAVTALKKKGFSDRQVPSCSNMAKILNRMGYRLRNVVKSKPLKKSKRQMQYLKTSEKQTVSQKITKIS
jgi:hypothetical protein